MVRFILFAAFIAIVAFAIVVLLGTWRTVTQPKAGKDDAIMPVKFQRITYVLLIVLMFGVTTGWLGGL